MRVCFVFLACLGLSCHSGPETGTVSGTITLDGKPVEDGFVRFVPADGQSQPADSTVIAGQYTVTMPTGEKKVEVYWAKTKPNAKPVDTASPPETVTQLIPPKYNATTELRYTIVKGAQTKDFPLSSK
jgi:hypothetical protein